MNPNATSDNVSRLIALPVAIPSSLASPEERGRWLCEQLESGNILFFRENPFPLSSEDREFLLGLRQTSARVHKNIAYRPLEGRLTGLDRHEPPERAERLRAILQRFSDGVTESLCAMLPAYAAGLRRDFASFRPLEERGRPLRLRARNDLLHTDAFPTRPTHGDRILRVFTNLNPTEPRVWHTSETFEALARRFARDAGLPTPHSLLPTPFFARLGRLLGIPAARRSPYDRFMLRFHNFLKENQPFQETCAKQRWEFPPGSAWVVFTDMVSHAVLSGQFAVEQTFIVPRSAMVLPAKSPIAILENICGYPLGVGSKE
jgi:hypothetical protein